ncbi:MAG: DUF3395 domain-containing protein [Flavobacterium sp.]|nr:DUF3395 domain-containing protein [Flavobacterium sp.]
MKEDRIYQFVIKLIKLTKGKEIKWSSEVPADRDLIMYEKILDKVYTVTVGQAHFRLYKIKYQSFIDEYEYIWLEKVKFESIDFEGNVEYGFEYDNSFNDLYEIVREQSSNINIIIENILGIQLKIIEAKYFTTKAEIDITTQLQNKVTDNSLKLKATNAIAGDPDPGIKKKLKVKYSFDGKTYEEEFKENEIMNLP